MENLQVSKEGFVHDLFEITIFLKGLNAAWEVVLGILLLVVQPATIHRSMLGFANYRFMASLAQSASGYIVKQANHFSQGTQYFIGFYLLFYGVVNIFLVIFLLRGKLWAYPVSLILFALFIVYQVFRLWLHRSQVLLFFTSLDIILVALTFLEYRRIKKSRKLILGE